MIAETPGTTRLGLIAAVCACIPGCGAFAPAYRDVSLRGHMWRGGLVGKRYELTQDALLLRQPWKRSALTPPPQPEWYRPARTGGPSRVRGGAVGWWGKRHIAGRNRYEKAPVRTETVAKGTRLKIVGMLGEYLVKPPPVYYVTVRIGTGPLKGSIVDVSQLIEDCVPPDSIWRELPVVANDQYLKPVVPTEPDPNVPQLLRALDSRDWSVRHRAVELLGKANSDIGLIVPALLDAMTDPDAEVGYQAIESLGQLGPPAREAVPVLVAEMKKKDAADGKCRRAASAVARIEGPVSPTLLQALDDETWNLRFVAAGGLASLGPRASGALPRLLEFLAEFDSSRDGVYNTPEYIGQSIHQIAGGDGVAAVMQLLKSPSEQTRWNATRALGRMTPEAQQAMPILIEMVQHERFMTRIYAIDTLGEFGERAAPAVAVLVEAVRDQSEVPGVRGAAARALDRIGPKAAAAVPDLIALLESDDWTSHENAMGALCRMGPAAKDAIPAIRRLALSGKPAYVREAARQVLKRIAGKR